MAAPASSIRETSNVLIQDTVFLEGVRTASNVVADGTDSWAVSTYAVQDDSWVANSSSQVPWDDLLWAATVFIPLILVSPTLLGKGLEEMTETDHVIRGVVLSLQREEIPELARRALNEGLAFLARGQFYLEQARALLQDFPRAKALWKDYLTYLAEARQPPDELALLLKKIETATSDSRVWEEAMEFIERIDEAEESCEQGQRPDLVATMKGWQAQVWHGLGLYYGSEGDYRGSALRLERAHIESFDVAKIWLRLREWDEAQAALRESIKINESLIARLELSPSYDISLDEARAQLATAHKWLKTTTILLMDWDSTIARMTEEILQSDSLDDLRPREQETAVVIEQLKVAFITRGSPFPEANATHHATFHRMEVDLYHALSEASTRYGNFEQARQYKDLLASAGQQLHAVLTWVQEEKAQTLRKIYAEPPASDYASYLRWIERLARHLEVSAQDLKRYLLTGQPGSNKVLADLPRVLQQRPDVLVREHSVLHRKFLLTGLDRRDVLRAIKK